MNQLLAGAIQAHGGLDRWKSKRTLSATFASSGDFLALKGIDQDRSVRTARIDLHRQWASITPFAKAGQRTDFTPDRVAIETTDGKIIAERRNPRASFARHDMRTCWDPLHRAYYTGYALWTYLTTPFLLAMDGVIVRDIEPWHEGAEIWRGLQGIFPPHIAGHSSEQSFYFGPDLLIRRHDYRVEVAGNFAATQYISEPVEVDGIWIPTRRKVYLRDENMTPMLDTQMVDVELSEFHFGP